MINKLTILVVKYPSVKAWLFKIDGEFGGRGLARFQLESIRVLNEALKNLGQISEDKISKIRDIVATILPSKLVPAHPSLYPSYAEYIDMLVSRGGIIEAAPECEESKISSPSLFFKIDPDGQITVLCAYDRLLSREYVNYACAFPQTSLPNLNIKQLCTSVGNNLYSKGVYGYITVDMAAFPDVVQKGHPLFWMIGLDVYLNQLSSGFFAFDFLTKGVIDKVSGRYFLAPKDNSNILGAENQSESNALEEFEERSYIYIPFLLHDGLSKYNYRDFFQLCRKSQISYDLEKKLGYVFVLSDRLEMGVLSLLTINESSRKSVKSATDAINFVLNIGGSLVNAADSNQN